MVEGQLELTFNVLNGGDVDFRVAERRVVVTPDESLTDETQPPQNEPTEVSRLVHSAGAVGLCKRCGKGQVSLIKYSKGKLDAPPEIALRCTYCQ